MEQARSTPRWALPLLLLGLLGGLVGLTLLYLGPLRTHFLNDDYLFLEQARTQPLGQSLTQMDALGNYYRPLSRQLYFAALTPIGGGQPGVFHGANFALYLGALALLADLMLALVTPVGAVAALLYFALLPFQRVVLTWVSCSQDLMALVGTLGALALHRRGRRGLGLLAAAAALASKEAALPLIVALVAWDVAVERRRFRDAAKAAWPYALLSAAWVALTFAMRRQSAAAPLDFSVSSFAAAYVHMIQSLAGVENPSGFLAGLAHHAPALLPFVALAPLALAFGAGGRATAPPLPGRDTRSLLAFAGVWLVAFGAMIGPVAYTWSSYHYTLAAVGSAVAIGVGMRAARPVALLGLIAALLWIHAGTNSNRAFSTAKRAWVSTSHLTSFYFDRVAAYTDSMSAQLVRIEPHPPADARMFFSTLPSFAGFVMGNGPLVRALYHEPGIKSYFLSQFRDTTAVNHPCRFLSWDGERLVPMYAGADTFFQVGSDLLLMDHVDGALHAFRRGAAAGENRMDLLYWIGWGELWAGHRDAAESAWLRLGFQDDSLRWIGHLRGAHNALVAGDTLDARRQLITAIQYGVGRPEAHAILGELLTHRYSKYGLLELKVASFLNPRDWVTRGQLALGLADVRLDDAARHELEAVLALHPSLARDPAFTELFQELDRRAPPSGDVVEF